MVKKSKYKYTFTMERISLKTTKKEEFADLTPEVRKLIAANSWQGGAVLIYVPHTTAGITINENADPLVKKDILAGLGQLIHDERMFQHLEGNSPAHLKASLIGSQQLVIIEGGQLQLGTWQGIFFCEFDGPRHRQVFLKLLG